MSEVRRVVVYNDGAEFGGHEAMTLRGVYSLASRASLRVSVIYYRANLRLGAKLQELQAKAENVTLIPSDFCSRSLQNLRSIINCRDVRRIRGLMLEANPDLVLVSQGRIEIGSAGLLAARQAGLRTISYIPMAHPVSISGTPVAVRLRDEINRYFYSLPDKFITISHGVRQMLLERGVRAEIAVVPNCIEPAPICQSTREEFRTRYGLEGEDYLVGIMGRILFRQKAQDFVLETLIRFRDVLRGFKFLFVGDGRDEDKLRSMIEKNDLGKMAIIIPWSHSTSQVYGGIDMLLIPSNFEGVPLVMLEAMSCGLRIVASGVDGMLEYLPPGWLFPRRNSCELVRALIRVREQEAAALLDSNKRRVTDQCDMAKFGLRFSDAVLA